MKTRTNRLLLFASAFVLLTMTSCNRGYGCPNVSVDGEGIKALLSSLLQMF